MRVKEGDFRNRLTGKVVKLPLAYAEPSHPFYDQFEYLGEDFEYEKVTVSGVNDDTDPFDTLADIQADEQKAEPVNQSHWKNKDK